VVPELVGTAFAISSFTGVRDNGYEVLSSRFQTTSYAPLLISGATLLLAFLLFLIKLFSYRSSFTYAGGGGFTFGLIYRVMIGFFSRKHLEFISSLGWVGLRGVNPTPLSYIRCVSSMEFYTV